MNRLTHFALYLILLATLVSCSTLSNTSSNIASQVVEAADDFSFNDLLFGDGSQDPVRDAIQAKDNNQLKQLLESGKTTSTKDSTGSLPVHLAAASNNTEALQLLKEHGADVTAVDGRGDAPIHLAAFADATDSLSWLLEQGIEAEARNDEGQTPAEKLIYNGKSEGLAILVAKGLDVNRADASGDTLLHKAVQASNSNAVSALLQLQAEPYSFNSKGQSALHLSAQLAKQAAVIEAFKANDVDLNHKDASGDAAIHLSIKKVAVGSQQKLIDLGADLTQADKNGIDVMAVAVKSNNAKGISMLHKAGIAIDQYNPQGYAPIHQAVVFRRKASLETLLEEGANTEQAVKNKGTTALHLSARLGFSSLQKILSAAGARMDARDKAGNTATHYAARFNHTKSLKQSIKDGSNINQQNYRRQTPAHVAIEANSSKALKALIKSGADLSLRDLSGDQPLHSALKHDHSNDVRLLLAGKADPNAVNGAGLPALFQSSLSGDVHNISYLVKAGARLNTTDRGGFYPLHRAAQAGREKAAFVLAKSGHPLEQLTPRGDTAAHIAARRGYVLTLRALAKVGANIDQINTQGNTPLHAAVAQDASQSVGELLDLGANTQLRDFDSYTPLLRAVVDNKPESVNLLMQQGPAGQRDPLGNTALLLAMQRNDDAMARLILRLGGAASEANFDGVKPLPLALQQGNYQLANDLVSHGADVTEPLDQQGNTACDITTDAAWQETCFDYFRDPTYLSSRERWLNLGQPQQYNFSKWFTRIPQSRPTTQKPIAAIREQADFKMRYYLAFSDPDNYLSELAPPEEETYAITKQNNESDEAYFERGDFITNNYQNDYQKRLAQYEGNKQHRLKEIAAFKSYHHNGKPSRRRIAVDINADAVQSYLRTPLRATKINYDDFDKIFRAQLAAPDFAIDIELKGSEYKPYIDYLAKNGLRLPWYMAGTVGSEFFTLTHIIVSTPQGHTYLPLKQNEYRYLLQRFITLRGEKSHSTKE